MNAPRRVPVHRITGTDDPPAPHGGNFCVPEWLWRLTLDYPTTDIVRWHVTAAWWQGWRWGIGMGVGMAVLGAWIF